MAAIFHSSALPLIRCQQRSCVGCNSRVVSQPASRDLVFAQRCSRRASLLVRAAAEKVADETAAEPTEPEFGDEDDGVGLTTHQVEQFLSTLCEETEIAELEIQMGSFSMKVRRSLSRNGGSPVATASLDMPSPIATQSLDMSAFQPASPTVSQSITSFDEEEEESLVPVEAPKVGVLRRGKYMKGKKIGKGTVVEIGDKVKKGQPLAYVEQLGTFVPLEAPQAGEIVSFVVEDGAPVEYGEVVVELAPFFGGHIIGDSKYA